MSTSYARILTNIHFSGSRKGNKGHRKQQYFDQSFSQTCLSSYQQHLQLYQSACQLQKEELHRQKNKIQQLEEQNSSLSKEIFRINKETQKTSSIKKKEQPFQSILDLLSKEVMRLNIVVSKKDIIIRGLEKDPPVTTKFHDSNNFQLNELSKECLRLNRVVQRNKKSIQASYKKEEVLSTEISRLHKALLKKSKNNTLLSSELQRLNTMLDESKQHSPEQNEQSRKSEVDKEGDTPRLKISEKYSLKESSSFDEPQKKGQLVLSRDSKMEDRYILEAVEGQTAILVEKVDKKVTPTSLNQECAHAMNTIQTEVQSFLSLVAGIEAAHKQIQFNL